MADTSSERTDQDRKTPPQHPDRPLSQTEMGDKDAGGLAGQGGMRDPDKTSDPDQPKPS